MHRLFLAAFITAFALHADTFTSTTCTSGTTTISPCGGSLLFPGGLPDAVAAADASDTGIINGAAHHGQPPITDGWSMSTGATAVAQGSENLVVSATAHAKAFDTFLSNGPVRPGFIQFNVSLDQLHGGDSTVVLTDGVNTYSYEAEFGGGSTPSFGRCFEGCQWMSTVPFDLGVDFQVNASSDDGEIASFSSFVNHGYTDAVVTFRLLEADETTPVPFSAIPEPSTWVLLLLGLSACGRLAWCSRIKH